LIDRESAGGAKAIAAAMDRRASGACRHTRLAQHSDRHALSQRGFEDPQLGVDARERLELGRDDLVVAAAEAVQVEYQAAEVSIGELPRRAQEAGAAAHAPAVEEAGLLRRRLLCAWLLGALRGVRLALCLRRCGTLLCRCARRRTEISCSLLGMAVAGARRRRGHVLRGDIGVRPGCGVLRLLPRLRGALDVPLSSEDPQH
jgi:hypothetical protein